MRGPVLKGFLVTKAANSENVQHAMSPRAAVADALALTPKRSRSIASWAEANAAGANKTHEKKTNSLNDLMPILLTAAPVFETGMRFLKRGRS